MTGSFLNIQEMLRAMGNHLPGLYQPGGQIDVMPGQHFVEFYFLSTIIRVNRETALSCSCSLKM